MSFLASRHGLPCVPLIGESVGLPPARAFAPIWLRSTGPPGAGPGRWVDRAKRTPLYRSQTGHVPGARRAEQAGIARISNASNLGSGFRYHTHLRRSTGSYRHSVSPFRRRSRLAEQGWFVAARPPYRTTRQPASQRRRPSQALADKGMARSIRPVRLPPWRSRAGNPPPYPHRRLHQIGPI